MWIRASLLVLLFTALARAEPPLPDCPSSPNCVSSLASDPDRRVEPLPGAASARESLQLLRDTLQNWPRAKLVEAPDERSLHVVFKSRIFGFKDDMHLHVREDGSIEVRSASRLGYWDLGANRRRVEKLRNVLDNQRAND